MQMCMTAVSINTDAVFADKLKRFLRSRRLASVQHISNDTSLVISVYKSINK